MSEPVGEATAGAEEEEEDASTAGLAGVEADDEDEAAAAGAGAAFAASYKTTERNMQTKHIMSEPELGKCMD